MAANICLGIIFQAYLDNWPVCFVNSCIQSGTTYVPSHAGQGGFKATWDTALSLRRSKNHASQEGEQDVRGRAVLPACFTVKVIASPPFPSFTCLREGQVTINGEGKEVIGQWLRNSSAFPVGGVKRMLMIKEKAKQQAGKGLGFWVIAAKAGPLAAGLWWGWDAHFFQN